MKVLRLNGGVLQIFGSAATHLEADHAAAFLDPDSMLEHSRPSENSTGRGMIGDPGAHSSRADNARRWEAPEMHSTGVQCPFYSWNKSNTNAGEKTPPDMGQPGRGNPGLEGARH